MAAGDFTLFGAAKEAIAKNTIDLDTNSFVAVLVTSSWTPAPTTEDTWSDISANEVANGNGYTTGGTAVTITVNRSGGTVTVDASDVSWAASSITAKYCVICKKAGGSLTGTDLLLGYADLKTGGGSVSTDNGDFDVLWNASGIFTMS